jgi:hypothetical protein
LDPRPGGQVDRGPGGRYVWSGVRQGPRMEKAMVYYISKKVGVPFDTALERVREG